MKSPSAADFLTFRFRNTSPDCRIELRTFKPNGSLGPRSWHRDPCEAAEHAATLPNHLTKFYGCNPRTEGGGKKEHVIGIIGAYADLDFKRYQDGEAGAWAALGGFPLQPTWVIHSGGGLQAYWDFTAAITDTAQFPAFEVLLSRLAVALNGDPAVAELARVLRLPGSYNSKKEYGTPRLVTIARHNPDCLHTLEDFERVLPAPEPQRRPRTAYPRGGQRAGDVPGLIEAGEMLRHIDPQPGYDKWLAILAGLHDAYGADGEALAEAWSGHVSKPGEIAAKFKSFGNYKGTNGKGNATIATVIYEAKQGGYRPPQATYHTGPTAASTGNATDDAALIATLAADVQRLGNLVRERDATIAQLEERHRRDDEDAARLVGRITELETEKAALEASITHHDQATGVGALDFVEGAQRAYQGGDVLTLGGQDFARNPIATAANRRAPKTVSRGMKALIGLAPTDPWPREPVAFGRDGKFAIFAREETIETPTFKGKVEIPYIHIPLEFRSQRGKAVLGILPTCTGEKKHGGRRTIPVPPEVAAQADPVRRKREHVTRWYSALTDKPLAAQTEHLGTDYWTAQGEQLLPEEVERQRVDLGHEPPRVPTYRPTVQPPLRIFRTEEPRQDADSLTMGTCRQDAEVPEPPPGRCPDCGAEATIGGYCQPHFNQHLQRHSAVWGAAAGD